MSIETGPSHVTAVSDPGKANANAGTEIKDLENKDTGDGDRSASTGRNGPMKNGDEPHVVDKDNVSIRNNTFLTKIHPSDQKEKSNAPLQIETEFNTIMSGLVKSIGDAKEAMTESKNGQLAQELLPEVVRQLEQLEEKTDEIFACTQLSRQARTAYSSTTERMDENVVLLKHDISEFLKNLNSETIESTSSSYKLVKEQLENSKKEKAALRAEMEIMRQQMESTRQLLQLQQQALENRQKIEDLKIKRELQEKQAELMKNDNLGSNHTMNSPSDASTSFKDIQNPVNPPAMDTSNKVNNLVLNTNPLPQQNLEAASYGNVYHAAGYNHRMRPKTRIPDIKIWTFNGDSTQYQEWENSFKALVENRVHCTNEKMNLLKQHLGPEPMKVVKSYFMNGTEESYQKAIAGLRSRYGSSVVVGQSFLNQLKHWRPIREEDKIGLREFADYLEQVAECKKTVPELKTLDYASNHVYVAGKLPPSLLERWQRKVSKHKFEMRDENAYPPFERFVYFVKHRAEYKNLPEFQ